MEPDRIETRLTQDGERWRSELPDLSDPYAVFVRRVARRRNSHPLLSAAAALLIAVVGTGAFIAFVTRPPNGPVAQASPTAAADASPTTIPESTPSPATTASPTALAIPTPTTGTTSPSPTSPIPGWISLGSAHDATWSPDSAYIATADAGGVTIFDAGGSIVRTFAGADEAIWEDGRHVLLRDSALPPVDGATQLEQPAAIYRAGVDSAQLERVGSSDGWPVPSARGPIAFASDAGEGSFTVFDRGQWADAVAGYPLQWSPNGDMLAVTALVEQTIGLAGHLTILAWPSLEPVAADTSALVSPNAVRFSPTGRFVAFTYLARVHVLDLETDKVRQVGPDGVWDWFGWNADDQLVIGNPRTGTIASFAVDGTRTTSWPDVGDAVIATPDGETLLFFTNDYPDEPPPMTLARAGGTATIDLPMASGRQPILAPDGRSLLVFAAIDGDPTLLLAE